MRVASKGDPRLMPYQMLGFRLAVKEIKLPWLAASMTQMSGGASVRHPSCTTRLLEEMQAFLRTISS